MIRALTCFLYSATSSAYSLGSSIWNSNRILLVWSRAIHPTERRFVQPILMIYLPDFEMHLSHPGEFVSRRSSTHCQAAWWLRNALLNWAFRLIRVPGRSLKSSTSLWALLNPYNPLSTLTIKHSNRFTMKLPKIVTVRSGDLAGGPATSSSTCRLRNSAPRFGAKSFCFSIG